MRKKFLVIIFAIVMCITLVGCGKKENNSNTNKNKEGSSSTNSVEVNAQDGELVQILDEEGNPTQTDFVINGLILIGNRHGYDGISEGSEEIIETFAKEGFKKTGINSTFYLNEYIEFYMDSELKGKEEDVRICVVPNDKIEKLEKMKHDDLEVLALEKGFIMNYTEPEKTNHNYVNEGYVSMDYPEGKYIVLFTYKNKITYYITLDLTKEPAE